MLIPRSPTSSLARLGDDPVLVGRVGQVGDGVEAGGKAGEADVRCVRLERLDQGAAAA